MLFDLLSLAQSGQPDEPRFFAPDGNQGHAPVYERINAPAVMAPWEIRCHVRDLLAHCTPAPALAAVAERLDRFVDSWAAAWAAFGESPDHLPTYMALAHAANSELVTLGADTVGLDNGLSLGACLRAIVLRMAVAAPREAGARRPRAIPGGPRADAR